MAGPASAGDPPTAQEQYMLELVNRMRVNPDGEVYRLRNLTWGDSGSPQPPDLNEGIISNFLTPESRPPLAFNDVLVQAARNYSQTLLANNAFQHYYGGTTPQSRMQAAGYVFSGSWGWGENIALNYSSNPLSIDAGMVAGQYEGLFIDGNVADRGHRRNLLDGTMKEVGIGFAATSSASYTPPGGSGNWYAVISTQDFAYSTGSFGGKAFLTGVAYSDSGTLNDFYDPGEGLANVTVTATPVGGGTASSTTTWASGGYSLPLNPGTYNVVFSGGGLPGPVTYANVAVASSNVKLDATSSLGVWNTDGNGDWATAANWSGILPNGSGKVATFAGAATAPRTVSLSSPQTVGTINFDNPSAGYTISGSSPLTLQLSGDSAQVFVYAGSHSIGTPLSLASGVDVTVLAATDSLTLSGPISNATAKSIVKLGKGRLELSGNNSFSGGLAVTDGTIAVGSNNGLGSAAVTLGFSSDDTSLLADSAVTVGNAIQVATGPGGVCTLGTTPAAGAATFSGQITLGHDLFLTAPAGGTLVLSGAISGSGGLTKTGLGLLVLSDSNGYTGGTTVSSGTLEFLNRSALPATTNLTIGAGGTLIFNPAAVVASPAASQAGSPLMSQAVPEPSTAALLGIGVLALLGFAWRRRRRQLCIRH